MRPSDSAKPVRARNLLLVAEHVNTHGSSTRADLARATGLSRTAVSSLVSELLERRILVEPGQPPTVKGVGASTGRPAVELSLNPDGGALVGIHLAHDGVRIVLADLATTVIDERNLPIDVDHEPTQTLEYAASAGLALMRDHHLEPRRVLGLGVAVAAPLTLPTHSLSPTTVLHDWAGVDIARHLYEHTGLPVHIGNDANLGAIAEWRMGAARAVDDLIYVMVSDGVGAGLILGGRLYEGGAGGAGELGNVTVQPDGRVCRCGNRGCLETVVGARALVHALSYSGAQVDGIADIVALAEHGHPGVKRVLVDAGRAIGQALAGPCTVLDPRLVVVGGKTAKASAPLIQGIHDALSLALSPLNNRGVGVVVGQLGDRAEILGALTIAGTAAVTRMLDASGD